MRLRIGSRPSKLALVQASWVKHELERRCVGLAAEIVAIRTMGDKLTTPLLAEAGGKGLFVRELEGALAGGLIDLAVHSMKDLPARLAPPFRLAAVPPRAPAADVLVAPAGGFDELPRGARLATASLRRKFQALRRRPDLQVVALRGNVDTRLAKLQKGEFDALVLAAAGLERLSYAGPWPIRSLPEEDFVPAGGQGALAVQALLEPALAPPIEAALLALNDPKTACEVGAERAFLAAIGASCASPVGARATAGAGELVLRALLFSLDGARAMGDSIAIQGKVDLAAAERAGVALAQRMLAAGAGALIGNGG